MLTRNFNFICFLLIFVADCFAQNPPYTHYSVKDELPSMEVYHILQDSKGSIWLATTKGVARFNGSNFENFTVENGLPDNEIILLFEDAKKRIWFLSFTGALSFYQNQIIHNSTNTPFLRQAPFQQPINAFAPLSNGDIIFCAQNKPTYLLHDSIVQLLDSSSNYAIFEKENKNVLMLDYRSEFLTEWKNYKQTSKLKVPYKMDYDKCKYNAITDLFLIARHKGLHYIENQEQHLVEGSAFYKEQHTRFMTVDKEGYFWLSANDGCYRFLIDTNHRIKNLKKYFEGFVVNDVFEDADHNFWIATRGDGLLMCPSLHVKVFNKSSGLADDNITTAAKTANGTLICGTLNGNLHTIRSENKITETINLQSLRVRKIVITKDGAVWIASDRNIFKKEKTLINKTPIANTRFKTIAAASDGGLLVGGYSRVYKIHNSKVDSIVIRTDIIRFYALCESTNQKLFLGTEKGLYVYDNDSLIPFHHERKPFTGHVDDIGKTKSGTILSTTHDSGIAVIGLHDEINFISTTNGLQSNNCTALFSDTVTNKVYVGTGKGLSIIQFENNNQYQIRNYNAANGLACGSIYSIDEKDGEILICTDRGLIIVSENDLQLAYELPKVALQKIEINNKETKFDSSQLFLHHDENNIRITFSGTAYRDVKSLMYRYKLSPLDTGWNTTASTTIIYPELSPGNYRFEVQVRKGDFMWSENVASFHFEIAKPYWQTWWFRVLMIVLSMMILYSIYRYRLHLSQQKNEIATVLLQTELRALRAQINPHFIFNSLNSIQDFIFNNEKEAANEYLTQFAQLMRMILDNSSKKFISLAEEIDFLKIYLQLEGLRFADNFSYEIVIDKNINTNVCYLPPMILQLYLENAIIHGLASKNGDGKLLLSFALINNDLNCTIEDNGIGRKKSGEQNLNSRTSKHQSHGLNNTNERIEAINKTSNKKIEYQILDLENENGLAIGTKIKITFPQEVLNKK